MAGPLRVVIVGGHPVILGVVRLACAGRPELDVTGEATTGAEAIELLSRSPADLVILDLDLTDVDGLEVLRQLRDGGSSAVVLVLSDRTDGPTVLDAMRLGADGYLTKAEGLATIGAAIRQVLAGDRVVDPRLEQVAVFELGRFARQAREGSQIVGALTPRERQVLGLLSDGLTVQQIGRRLGISPRTVESHVAKLYRKLAVRTRVQAIARAAALGLIDFK